MKGEYMSIMDTLWPWKALRELRSENRGYIIRMADDMIEIESLKVQIKHLENDTGISRIRIALQKDEIMRLNEKLKTAVLRDPKTGRLTKPAAE